VPPSCRPSLLLPAVLPLCYGNLHVLGEARRAFYHVPGRTYSENGRVPGRSCRAGCRVPLGHVRYHGHVMRDAPKPMLTDNQAYLVVAAFFVLVVIFWKARRGTRAASGAARSGSSPCV